MRITQRATRRRILSRVKPTTASGLAVQTEKSLGKMLLSRLDKLEDFVAASNAGHDKRLASILENLRGYVQEQRNLNSEVRHTMTAGPFSPDALSKMFQRMDNQMTVLKQTLDPIVARMAHHG